MRKIFICAIALIAGQVLISCSETDPLPSWNDTELKAQIIDYVENTASTIAVEDRVAVFDMDGTIACEQPLWFEMAVAVQRLVDLQEADPSLRDITEYEYARKLAANPRDTSVLNNWFANGNNYLESILTSAFVGMDSEEYIAYATEVLNTQMVWNGMKYHELFYQPMLELIEYLKSHDFDVYIVSGSAQAIVWSICPQEIGFDRRHLIGSRQNMRLAFSSVYDTNDSNVEQQGRGNQTTKLSYIIEKGWDQPKNNYYGKGINIYNTIGKLPVFAAGNTVGDFGMFKITSSNSLPNFVLMVNHDDAERELAYPPYYTGEEVYSWEDSLAVYGWHKANMSEEFATIWKK